MSKHKVEVDVRISGVEKVIELAGELEKTLEKANSLVDELAKKYINIKALIGDKPEKIKGLSIDLTNRDIQPKEVKNE